MSTNYYDANPPRYALADSPLYHVCKRVTKDGRGHLIWAMTPERFGELTHIVDEYDRVFTKQEWLDEVLQHSSQTFERVGERFS